MTQQPNNIAINPVCAVGADRSYRPGRGMKLILSAISNIQEGHLTVGLPDGSRRVFHGPKPGLVAEIDIHSEKAIWRLLTGGMLGFNEAYMDGLWSTPDMAALYQLILGNEDAIGRVLEGKKWFRLIRHLGFILRPNTRRGSRRNIAHHYDLGNDFYAHWLDDSMTYSSARFSQPDEALEQAQRRKYDSLIAMLDIKPDHHVLEIGCGWGGFAEYLARQHGVRVTAITISQAQHDFARQRIQDAGLGHLVDIRLCDYRDMTGQFDRIASIEMFEAVGEAYWPHYFNQVQSLLTPDGKAALQIITIAERRFDNYRRRADYIQKYIFPGGMLPSPKALAGQIKDAGLSVIGQESFGACYANTLARWNQRFQEKWPSIRLLGFDGRFKRMWEQYLAYCQAGFAIGTIDVIQIAIAPNVSSPP